MEPASSIGAKDWTHVKRLTVNEGEGLRRSWGLDRRGVCVAPGRSYLENELTSACYTLTAPPAAFRDLQPDQIEAHLEWYAKVEGYRADAMFDLIDRLAHL